MMHFSDFKTLKVVLFTVIVTLAATFIFANLRNPHKELDYKVLSKTAVDDPRFAKEVGDLLDPEVTEGNKIETLANGDKIFPPMLKAIREAQKTITFESYIYWSGKVGESFAEALSERAKNGVKVHVLLDWAGSGKVEAKLIAEMKSSGVEVQRYHEPQWYNLTRMNNRTHRKILVTDGRIGFTGGVGIADEWSGSGTDPKHWRDTHYRIEGPVVNQMQSAFMDNWLKTQPEVHTSEAYFPEIKKAGDAKAQMFISSASEGGSSVRILYLMAIAAAKKSIYLQSAYFVPDAFANSQIVEARKRGVEVYIMVPGDYTDSAVVEGASIEQWGELLKAGVRIFKYQPALFHCKVLVVDSYFTSVGSTNFDERSFRLNDEANLNVFDKDFAEKQLVEFEKDLTRSKEISFDEWNSRPLLQKITGKLFDVFSSQL